MNMNKNCIKNSVNNLREYAKKKGLKLVFRNVTTNVGDFCFFIYAPKCHGYHTRYLIGYDGYWSAKPNEVTSFELCWKAANEFISN